MLKKYAKLLVHYSLDLKKGELLYIKSTTLAEPLIREIYREATKIGANVIKDLSFREEGKIFMDYADDDQLAFLNPIDKMAMETCDAYLYVRAPFNLKSGKNIDKEKRTKRSNATKELNQIYFKRLADGSLKRSLCQYPTQANAQEAELSLEEYEEFVFGACKLYEEDPVAAWLEVRKSQQKIVDFLNQKSIIRYVNKHSDISFSVEGRTWINSDGMNNMPSGEVFSAPVEDSVNGEIVFDYPSIYMGQEASGIKLKVKDGEVVEWSAERGGDLLDQVFSTPGARFFGEVAIGTNYSIQQATKNILFDEKIGGSVHMAVGQSYGQCGGKNESSIHWDMISDMRDGGKIYADGELIYENGQFLEI
ncbi:aminopeptidase [Portibacter lacus]|uniref:Aminopeptidase n=1 Tax=Portibacter lacus TaxID=1099794 RepID=A0AA37WE90_9BACT|nr:aminopeptidase [Portibacter lacus]GLR17698.1 aminopeptidase [Portibacter lacus]